MSVKLAYVDGTDDCRRWLSTCQELPTAIQKAQEIARYLRDVLNVPQDHIKVKNQTIR